MHPSSATRKPDPKSIKLLLTERPQALKSRLTLDNYEPKAFHWNLTSLNRCVSPELRRSIRSSTQENDLNHKTLIPAHKQWLSKSEHKEKEKTLK